MAIDSILPDLGVGWWDIFIATEDKNFCYIPIKWAAPEIRGYDLIKIQAIPGWTVYYHPDHRDWVYAGTVNVSKESLNGK